MPDPLGNVNNWLFVRKPEQTPPPTTSSPHVQAAPSPSSQFTTSVINDIVPSPALSHSAMDGASPSAMDVAMTQSAVNDDGGVVPSISVEIEEPRYTRRKIKEFLTHHTAYELIPESGKVVVLDVDLPLRHAFHALHEQGIASSPLYDSATGFICGIASASDFIATLQRLRNIVSSSSNPMSEAEMDQHTIRGLREEMRKEGRPPKDLVYVTPADSLAVVVKTLFERHCSMAPVLHPGPESTADGAGPEVLHAATLSGVLGCLMRHFRASLASLPLLAQPLHAVYVGTWSPDSHVAQTTDIGHRRDPGHGASNTMPASSPLDGCIDKRTIAPIRTVGLSTPLSEALGLLLDTGISCLPVVDEHGALLDIYARADITALAKANAYSRLQFEEVTVGQALSLIAQTGPPGAISGGNTQQWGGASPACSVASMQELIAAAQRQRVHMCSARDSLRSIVERLSVPGVRRLIVVNGENRKVEGIVSLSDIASFMLV